jgi:hypothetical protein
MVATMQQIQSQEYTFDDFVGTWNGTISSTYFEGYNDPITMAIESDGFYTETSGHLMPSLYPNTQQCEYQASTNRMHWWYLGTVWGGQYFYDHFYYEVVYFQNDTLEMHYNFWDDPQPNPDAGTIFLVKESLTPPPTVLQSDVIDNTVSLTWNLPVYGNGGMADPTSYKVYYKMGEGSFEFLETTYSNYYTHENVTAAGMHAYYVTAIYDEGESNPSNQVNIVFTTPPPTNLQGQLLANYVSLNWDQPFDDQPMAGLLGYNIYHKAYEGEYDLLMFVENNYYAHQDISAGIHYYYITGVYDGAESDPSNEVMVELIISNVEDELAINTKLYPNPVSDILNIFSEYEIDAVKIFDQTGGILYNQKISSKNYRVDVNDFPGGLYVVQLETTKGLISKRVIVR